MGVGYVWETVRVIGVSVILVAVVSSVVIGGVAVLLVSLGVRLTTSIVRSVRDHPLLRGAAAKGGSGTGPPARGEEVNGDVSVGRTVWMVGCLIAAAVLQLVGMFLPLYHIHVPGFGHIPGRDVSITSYSVTPYRAVTEWLNLAFLMMLGYFAARRRSRIMAAIIIGYCALTLDSFVTFVADFTARHGHFGPGYYLLGVSSGAQVVALAVAIGILATCRSDRGHATVRGVWLGILAALLGAATAPINSVKVFGQSIWAWNGLPWQNTIGIVVGLLVLVLVPLFALRIADRTAAGMALGLAAARALSATEALLQKLSFPEVNQLTVGFWLTILGAVTLVLLAFALTKQYVKRPASPPLPASVT